jgi:cell wall-associated NlpC family hydrolase
VIEKYLSRRFNYQTSNCWHLVRDFWYELHGVQLPDHTPSNVWQQGNAAAEAAAVSYRELTAPADPCIVLLRFPRGTPHVGVYYQGRVLHITPYGAFYQTLDTLQRGWRTCQFYVPCST